MNGLELILNNAHSYAFSARIYENYWREAGQASIFDRSANA